MDDLRRIGNRGSNLVWCVTVIDINGRKDSGGRVVGEHSDALVTIRLLDGVVPGELVQLPKNVFID